MLGRTISGLDELASRRRRDDHVDQPRHKLAVPKHVDPEADEEDRRQPDLDKGDRGERDEALARP